MDKKDKDNELNPFELQSPAGESVDDSASSADKDEPESYGRYLFGSGYVDINKTDGEEKANWSSYTWSRMAVRLVSRGILGAGLYTWAHHEAPRQLAGYDVGVPLAELGGITKYPLRYIARGFDVFAGTPIQKATYGVSRIMGKSKAVAEHWSQEAIWFRDKQIFVEGKEAYSNGRRYGRSLGHEITGMTFDFAGGSVGDAVGRQVASAIDPNIRNGWSEKDKDGKVIFHPWREDDGHINVKNVATSIGKEAWQIFSKNQGEDWAVALPYVYQMKWQRQALGKAFPGFKETSDRQLNGGSYIMHPDGPIIDSYAKPGALDLQLRFTGYNWYTLMYRESYDMVADTFKSLRLNDGKLPNLYIPDHPFHAAVDTIGSTLRYVVKSGIKAGLYMTPAVPTFWITRTPQTKFKGIVVNADSVNNVGERSFISELPESQFGHYPKNTSDSLRRYDPVFTTGAFDRLITPIGKASYLAGEKLYEFRVKNFGVEPNLHPTKNPTITFANASISYTPYMITKAETALRWDNGLMDKAIYRLLDGVFALNIKEVGGGLMDIREQIIHPASNRVRQQVSKEDEIRKVKRVEELTREREEKKRAAEKAEEKQDKHATPGKDVESVELVEKGLSAKVPDKAMPEEQWQHRHMHEKFAQDTSVPSGASIH